MPSKKTVTVRHANGQTSTPDVKVVVNERAMIEALNATVADLQNRVRMLETRQIPAPPRPQNPYPCGLFAASLDQMRNVPTLEDLIGQPNPMYARMGATPIPNQMYAPGPQPMYMEPKLRNPATVNKIMSTDLRMFGFTEAQIEQLHKHGIFVLGKLIAVFTRAEETTLSLKMYENADLLRKAHILLEWIKQFIADTASIINPAIDNANNLLACMAKEGEKNHGDHV